MPAGWPTSFDICAGPPGSPSRRVDWFERALRRERVQSSEAALRLWEKQHGELPGDLARVREAKDRPEELARAIADLAGTMAARQSDDVEPRVAAAIATAMAERAELEGLAPEPRSLGRTLAEVAVRIWSGPAEGRVRIADPYRLRAARFDCVFIASLQDGEFPRRDGRADPFLSESQRESLGLPPRRDTEAEERYLFHASLALPRRQLFLSFRDSDENGAAEPRSPFLDDVRRLLEPAPAGGESADPVEAELIRTRDLAQVVHRVAEAPSEEALGRAIAAHGRGIDPRPLLTSAGAAEDTAGRLKARLEAARRAEAASREPGPISNPAVIEGLAAAPAYGGTTLEGFDVCSYLWFVSHELLPERLDPVPDPLVQGGLMHAVLDRLYREAIGGDPLPRPGSLAAWIERAHELIAEIAAERGIGSHPTERTIRRRVEGLLTRFLGEEAARRHGWLRTVAAGGEVRGYGGKRAARPGCRRLASSRRYRSRRSSARRARPGPRLQALGLGHPAEEAGGEGEASAAALPDRCCRAVGSECGRRPLSAAAGHAGPAAARPPPRGGQGRSPPTDR